MGAVYNGVTIFRLCYYIKVLVIERHQNFDVLAYEYFIITRILCLITLECYWAYI